MWIRLNVVSLQVVNFLPMRVCETSKELRGFLSPERSLGNKIGLVPTMGALHLGHLELVKQALADNDVVVVSIFVNPAQFDKPDDLDNYPRDLDSDLKKLTQLSEGLTVFAPSVGDMYGDGIRSKERFDFDGLDTLMEGKYRKGHFQGVGAVVKRLFGIVQPERAYFGEKDYQQLLIIKKLVEKLSLPVEVVSCPIYRESNGLAMSSRNQLLSSELRSRAGMIYETLTSVKEKFISEEYDQVQMWVLKKFEDQTDFTLEYFVIANAESLTSLEKNSVSKKYRAFIAAHAGDIRLIDNIALN